MRHSRRNFLQIVSAAIPAAPIVASAGRLLLAKDGVRQAAERLVFQTSRPWSPRINLNADAVLVYGIGQTLPSRIESWRAHGYHIEVMTGIAWGRYQNYLDGQFDGKTHDDEAQTDQFGNQIRHGSRPGQTIYYMVPTESYIRFVTAGLEKALDAGAKAICLEEPEFWVRGGYSEAFKREWRAYYGEGWIAPDSSPDAQYRASKLKYYLYRRALTQAFDFVHKHSEAKRKRTACYVATHSLLNYSQWRIVSPESSLEQVNCDGYIAQVWTGTARTPNVYQGRKKERTFETAPGGAHIAVGTMCAALKDRTSRISSWNVPSSYTWRIAPCMRHPRMQPVRIELGTPSNPAADSCLVYNYYTSIGNPNSCATPAQGTGDNGSVMGIFDQDRVNSSLSHAEAYTYDSLNRLTNAVATGNATYNLTFAYDRYGNMTCQTNGQTQGLCPN